MLELLKIESPEEQNALIVQPHINTFISMTVKIVHNSNARYV